MIILFALPACLLGGPYDTGDTAEVLSGTAPVSGRLRPAQLCDDAVALARPIGWCGSRLPKQDIVSVGVPNAGEPPFFHTEALATTGTAEARALLEAPDVQVALWATPFTLAAFGQHVCALDLDSPSYTCMLGSRPFRSPEELALWWLQGRETGPLVAGLGALGMAP